MKKCLVLDLDNTLWGGVIGEDGLEGIQLSLTAPGNSFLAFQQAILDLYDKGVILAINSTNNEADALSAITKHPNMMLKERHFAARRINWNDKAQNLKELAQELNIGLDSMVFLDDDKTNRDLVRALLPEVEVPELPADPQDYTRFLNSLNYFNNEVITDEDKMRGNLYVTERLRKAQEKIFDNKEDFLKSLGLELYVCEDDSTCIPRLSQMTEKTNQFNVFKNPLTEEQIAQFIKSPQHKVFYGRLMDRFGDYGVIIFALVDISQEVWNIRSLLMSCRVFNRSVEEAFLSEIIKRAIEDGALKIKIDFQESQKNAPAQEFVEKHFINGQRDLSEVFKRPEWIRVTA